MAVRNELRQGSGKLDAASPSTEAGMRIAFASLRSREVTSFGIMYVAAALEQAGHQVALVQVESAKDLVSRLRREPPDILGFSVTTGLHGLYLRWAALARAELGVRTLFGGPHPTFFPEVVEQPGLDAIVVGEAERTAVELCEALAMGDGRTVAGASYWLDGQLVRGPLRAPEQDLDALPLPNRDLYFRDSRFHRRFPVRSFVASRGCPFRCSYCFNGTLLELYRGMGKPVRFRSPAEVVREVEQVGRCWPMRLVWFLDANFTVSRSWTEELCERLHRRIRLPYYCKVRPDAVDARLAHMLGRTGCHGVGLGIESADDELRRELLDRRVSREQIRTACALLREQGIRVMSFNMVGLPGERYEQARSTLDLNVEAGVDYAMTMVFQPYPRTRLTDVAVERGLFDANYDSLADNYYVGNPLRRTADERRRIENLQRLFALVVEAPELRPWLDWLVERDLPRLYAQLFERFHEHCFYRRFYQPSRDAERRAAGRCARR